MKKQYVQPDALLIKLTSREDILSASTDEVFVDGENLFD